jgi:RHS repeat-associated protein
MWNWRYDGLLSDRSGNNSKHVFLGDTRIATKVVSASGSTAAAETVRQYYYHSDHLGSAQLITDYRGEEYERLEYTPYGELWIEKAAAVSVLDIPYRFTGKERDEETGLYYYGARYLDPKTSRWLSGDPALGEYVPSAPVNDEAKKRNGSLPGQGGVFNYVNLYVYHYAGNNPVKLVDPDGKITKEKHFGRNKYQNGYAPSNQGRMEKMVEMGLFTSWENTGTHNLDPNNDNPQGRWDAFKGGKNGTSTDYRGVVGTIFEGMQFVYDKDGNLVLDSANKGSFDFTSPDNNSIKHFFDDVKPWLDWGNGPADNPQDVPMQEDQWDKIERIYNQYKSNRMTRRQAAAEVQKVLPEPPVRSD